MCNDMCRGRACSLQSFLARKAAPIAIEPICS